MLCFPTFPLFCYAANIRKNSVALYFLTFTRVASRRMCILFTCMHLQSYGRVCITHLTLNAKVLSQYVNVSVRAVPSKVKRRLRMSNTRKQHLSCEASIIYPHERCYFVRKLPYSYANICFL